MSQKDTSVIPSGMYCYRGTVVCPYWSLREEYPEQGNGYCAYLGRGDWEVEIPEDYPPNFPISPLSLLWDQVKECGVNMNWEEEEELWEELEGPDSLESKLC